jgi:transcriptional regulator
MNNLSLAVDSLEWGRNKVLELASQGHSQSEIARIIQISQLTVNRDFFYLRQMLKIISKNTLMKDCQKNMRNVLLDCQ